MRLISVGSFLGLFTLALALVDHDGWEFYGGQKKRRVHGLNMATKDSAARNSEGGVTFDKNSDIKAEIIVTNDEAPPAPKFSTAIAGSTLRKDAGARIKSKEEILLLTDRFSVLNFDMKRSEGGETLPDSSWWGRLYIERFPSSIQYFRAHFGTPPPEGTIKFLLASPLNMCDYMAGLPVLKNDDGVDGRTVVVAIRGECTFGEKAIAAYEAGAAGILFINNLEGISHASGPDALDVEISAAMISRDDGAHLLQALTAATESIKGRFVPIACRTTDSNPYCNPVLPSDQEFVSSLEYKGKMAVGGVEFDYMQGQFGSHLNDLVEWTTVVPTVIGGDAYCCDKAGFTGNQLSKTDAILCLRGECEFVEKAATVESIGAGLIIVANDKNSHELIRMGSEPAWRGRNLSVATAMVGLDAYEHMTDTFYTNLDDSLTSTFTIIHAEKFEETCQNQTHKE